MGAVLHVLATKRVRIHYFCVTTGPTDFHFELNRVPMHGGPAAMEPERSPADHLLFLAGLAFYLPMALLWGARRALA